MYYIILYIKTFRFMCVSEGGGLLWAKHFSYFSPLSYSNSEYSVNSIFKWDVFKTVKIIL